MSTHRFFTRGFALLPDLLSERECLALAGQVNHVSGSVGSRHLLATTWCAALARRLRALPALAALISDGHAAIQCTYFEKSADRNWLVGLHQDLSVPVARRVDDPGLHGWSEKEGGVFVQAPQELLEQLVAVRVHLDDCAAGDGPLQVVPGSHGLGRLSPEAAMAARRAQPAVACCGARGTVLVMRPLLLHASSKASGTSRRRVLHFVYAPRSPGHGLDWPFVV